MQHNRQIPAVNCERIGESPQLTANESANPRTYLRTDAPQTRAGIDFSIRGHAWTTPTKGTYAPLPLSAARCENLQTKPQPAKPDFRPVI